MRNVCASLVVGLYCLVPSGHTQDAKGQPVIIEGTLVERAGVKAVQVKAARRP